MTSFLFSPADSEDLSTGVYYVHIVTSEPLTSATLVSDLTITTASTYVPYTLTGLTYTTTKWTFNNFTFPLYNFTTAPLGIVICKRLGSNFSSTDPIIYYADFINTLNQSIALIPGKYNLTVNFPISGIINFQLYYNYSAGAYVNTEAIPPGLIYLLSTRNNTQSWTSITNNSILPIIEPFLDLFNKSLDGLGVAQDKWAFSFGSRSIKVGTFAFWSRDSRSSTWSLYGSNVYTSGSVDVSSQWTLLGTSDSITSGVNFVTCNSNIYYKNLKLVCSESFGTLQEIEFYNSSMYSTDENLMSTVIDSSFESNFLDNSGWGHIWTNSGAATIVNNSLYLNGSSSLSLNTSSLFNLTNRNFKLSLDFKWISQYSGLNPGILCWDGGDYPLAITVYTNLLSHGVGTSSAWFYNPALTTNPSTSTFDSLEINRVGVNFTSFLGASFSGTSGSSVGDAGNIQLGINNGNHITGYIRNFKLIT